MDFMKCFVFSAIVYIYALIEKQYRVSLELQFKAVLCTGISPYQGNSESLTGRSVILMKCHKTKVCYVVGSAHRYILVPVT